MKQALHTAWNMRKVVRLGKKKGKKKVPGKYALVLGYLGCGFYIVRALEGTRELVYHEDDIFGPGEGKS